MSERHTPAGGRERSAAGRLLGRRRVLRAVGATALGGLGVAASSGSAAASGSAGWAGIEVVEFDETEGGDFVSDGDLSVVDELFVFVHGWLGDTSASFQAHQVLSSVEAGGFSPDAAVAIEWPATNLWYPEPEADTEGVGAELADLVETFADAGGGAARLTGHSLGGRVMYWTADRLADGYEIDTVGAMGTAAHGSTVCADGEWYDGVAENAGQVRNYHSENDRIVGTAYGLGDHTPLGTDGAPCNGAGNYVDVDVSSSVSNHLDYLGDEQVGADYADTVQHG